MTRGKAGACAAVSVVVAGLAVTGAGVANAGDGARASKVKHTTLHLMADPNGRIKFNVKKLSAKAGKVTFKMKDPASSGTMHGIGVKGNGVDHDGKIVNPGQTSTLTVTLKAGKYQFYCPVTGHAMMGMRGTLTVK